jgi:hypothetical protein
MMANALEEEDGEAAEFYYLEEKFGQRDVDRTG